MTEPGSAGQDPAAEMITIVLSTPHAPTPIQRTGVARAALQRFTVRQLLYWFTALEPQVRPEASAAAREAEEHTLLGLRELLATGWCEAWAWQEGVCSPIALDAPALAVAGREHEINLDVRPIEDNVPPLGQERRHPLDSPESELRPLYMGDPEELPAGLAPGAPQSPLPDMAERQGYVRRSDWLRAQCFPEVDVLDFRGLFVGNKGLEILAQPRPQITYPDPAYVAEVLLRGNGHRRRGLHAQALLCYQELVTLDPYNADYRFLLDATRQALASG